MEKEYAVMKVAGSSNVKNLAGAIAGVIRGNETEAPKNVKLMAVGASSCNQAIKAIAVARSYVALNGYDLVVRPGFLDGEINGESRTIIQMLVERA